MSRSREEIISEFKWLNATNLEFKALSEHLFEDETIEGAYSCHGFLADQLSLWRAISGDDGEKLLMIITNERLIGISSHDGGWFGKPRYYEVHIYWSDVAHLEVQFDKGQFAVIGHPNTGAVCIRRGVILGRSKEMFAQFAADLQSRVDAMRAQRSRPQRADIAGQGQLLDELERLAALKERGLITDDEFALAKRKLLQ